MRARVRACASVMGQVQQVHQIFLLAAAGQSQLPVQMHVCERALALADALPACDFCSVQTLLEQNYTSAHVSLYLQV